MNIGYVSFYFSLNENPEIIDGVYNIVDSYNYKISQIELSGPTLFALLLPEF
jgi:hypothetical protein